MFPVRCYTCNAVLAHRHSEYERRTRSLEHPKAVLDSFGVERICCRRMFLGFVEQLRHETGRYGNIDLCLDASGTVLHRRVRSERVVPCD